MIDRPEPIGTRPTADDPRWLRILARDRDADGEFWYSVRTTGVFCRPSCASRAARPEHVAFHDSLEAARASGARPCLRCDPEDTRRPADAERIARACRAIDGAEVPPSLDALASQAGLSAGHFHRLFKAATGLTPRGYARARRDDRLRAALPGSAQVTDALYAAGFGSSGRFYEAAPAILGMKPARYRRGGAGETLRHAIATSSLGLVLIAFSTRGIAAILIGDDAEALAADLRARFANATLVEADAGDAVHVAAVVALVEEPAQASALPLDIRGTAFQQRVWDALRAIPPGTTASYAQIADRIGASGAVRAVAGACAANAHAIAIPCHRVVRGDGSLSGYRWGVARKRALIDREAAAAKRH